ncbi:hypothetical protein C5O24_05360 [Paramuribaculum intestinale]|nr:hypothetical protein [Muribaculaceae bacterium]PWB10798.1 hypothetical protein C5O24_05360 [Paramuribaculum intestinale]ROS92212.1 hypothetical protein EEL36_09785 [Muribaculaceae bacterium Isolate-043 (Harlan)]
MCRGVCQRLSRRISKPHLWQGRTDPYLYKVVSCLYQDGRKVDEVVQPLGLRHYEIVAGKGFYLNGRKYPMYGVTRHQDWWGQGSALTDRKHDFREHKQEHGSW